MKKSKSVKSEPDELSTLVLALSNSLLKITDGNIENGKTGKKVESDVENLREVIENFQYQIEELKASELSNKKLMNTLTEDLQNMKNNIADLIIDLENLKDMMPKDTEFEAPLDFEEPEPEFAEPKIGDYIGFNPNPEGYVYNKISIPKVMKEKLSEVMLNIYYDKELTIEKIKGYADYYGIRMGESYKHKIKFYRDELLLKLKYVYLDK
jgi:hypothetical protein